MRTPKTLADVLPGKKSLVCFVTAGDPDLNQLPAIIEALSAGGADAIEIGIPFSDPIADGPIIQASSQRALDRGVTPQRIFRTLEQVDSSVPLVAMGYTNTAMRTGFRRFAESLASSGISASILSDLAPDDSADWRATAAANNIDTIFLAAPTSTDMRLKAIAEASTGFIYCVSRTGVTGKDSAGTEVAPTVSRVRNFSDLPICVGFGISSPEHVRTIWESADGAVIGSFIVDFLQRKWDSGKGRDELVGLIKWLKGA